MNAPAAGTGRALGYIRVSTQQQSLDAQRDALSLAGVQPRDMYADKSSGARADRPQFLRLLNDAQPGDTITVIGFDRFGRNTALIFQTLNDLTQKGIYVRGLREQVDTSTPAGRMVAGLFSVIAEYERELINERSLAAREARQARGLPTGRPRALSPQAVSQARALHDAGVPVRQIAPTLRCHPATLYRALQAQPPS